jgi:glutathionyl-hydroquinone reductase
MTIAQQIIEDHLNNGNYTPGYAELRKAIEEAIREAAEKAIDHMYEELDLDDYGVDMEAAWNQAKSTYLSQYNQQP